MAQGTERRQEADDRLAAQQAVEPVRLSGPGISAPQMPNLDLGAMSRLSRALGKWASERIVAQANKDQEAARMDGAMASVQGQTMDQLEMDGGDKFALQGWRITTAQTISAGLLAAQKQEIEDTDFALDPEQFRSKYVNNMRAAIDGQDAQTGRMISESMLAQMPELVAQHTIANTAFQERSTYTSVKQAIDLMSRDATSLGPLIQIATGGEGTQSAALSAKRQSSATTEGIVLAFTNMNPRAYDLLKVAGVLDGYSTEQLNRIENAKTQYQGRLRTELNRTRDDELFALDARVKQAAISPRDAVTELLAINSRHGIESDANDSQAMFKATLDPWRTGGKTRALIIQAARDRGDMGALAAATMGMLRQVESLDNPLAVGPMIEHGENKGFQATGAEQIMPRTLDNPGFGITPTDGTPEDNIRVAEEYWAMLVLGSEQSAGLFPWEPGDLEAAAIGYNAGWTRAKHWIEHDRNYEVLPDKKQSKEYWARWEQQLEDDEFPMAAERYNEAVHQAKLAKDAFALEAWTAASPLLADLDDQYSRGTLKREDWLAKRKQITDEYDGMRTIAMVNYERQFTKDLISTTRKQAGKRMTAAKADALAAAMIGHEAAFNAVIKDETKTTAEKAEALNVYRLARQDVVDALGIDIVNAKAGKFLSQAFTTLNNSLNASDTRQREDAEVQNKINAGTVRLLTPELRRRAFDSETKLFLQDIEDQWLASNEEDKDAIKSQAIDDGYNQMYLRLGMVDPDLVAKESNIAMRPYVNSDNVADPDMADMIRRYGAMKLVSTSLAREYLTPAARTRVNAVLSMAVSDDQIEQAQKHMMVITKTADEAKEFAMSPRSQELIAGHVEAFKDRNDTSGWLQAQALTSDADFLDSLSQLDTERRNAASDETRDSMTAAVEAEVARLWRVNPRLDAELLVETAWENINARSGLVGGMFIIQKDDVLTTMFGELASKYDKPNVMHLAVVAYLRTHAVQDEFKFINQFGDAELLPASWQNAISGSLFGNVGEYGRGLSLKERGWAGLREVRPFEGFVDAKGDLFARIFLPNGNYSQGIPIPLDLAGKALMAENPLF